MATIKYPHGVSDSIVSIDGGGSGPKFIGRFAIRRVSAVQGRRVVFDLNRFWWPSVRGSQGRLRLVQRIWSRETGSRFADLVWIPYVRRSYKAGVRTGHFEPHG